MTTHMSRINLFNLIQIKLELSQINRPFGIEKFSLLNNNFIYTQASQSLALSQPNEEEFDNPPLREEEVVLCLFVSVL
jgi:hypothetical protein